MTYYTEQDVQDAREIVEGASEEGDELSDEELEEMFQVVYDRAPYEREYDEGLWYYIRNVQTSVAIAQ